MFNVKFIRAAAERALKTFAQALAAALLVDGGSLLDADWSTALSLAGMAAILSVLTSFGSDALTKGSGPSLTDAEVLSPRS